VSRHASGYEFPAIRNNNLRNYGWRWFWEWQQGWGWWSPTSASNGTPTMLFLFSLYFVWRWNVGVCPLCCLKNPEHSVIDFFCKFNNFPLKSSTRGQVHTLIFKLNKFWIWDVKFLSRFLLLCYWKIIIVPFKMKSVFVSLSMCL
jgi:hypothetical protein